MAFSQKSQPKTLKLQPICPSTGLRKITVLLLLICSCQLYGQSALHGDLLTTADGLSQGMAFDMLQSRDGFIWIATKDGLNRYDGARFKVFLPDPFDPFSIAHSEVWSLFEDSRGWIWVMFETELDVFDPVNEHFYHVAHDGNKFFGEGGSGWGPIGESPDGVIWHMTTSGIWKINVSDDLLIQAAKKGISTIEPSCKMIPKPPGSVPVFNYNNLLIVTDEGLFRLEPSTEKISLVLPTSGWKISGLSMDAQGNIVGQPDLGYNRASQWFLINHTGIQFFTAQPAENFALSPDGSLWCARNGGIQKWDLFSILNPGIPELEINAHSILGTQMDWAFGCTKILFDKSGVVWVGTKGYGLLKISQKALNFRNYIVPARRFLEGPDGRIYSLIGSNAKYSTKFFQSATSPADFCPPTDSYEDFSGFSACFDAAGNGWSSNRRAKILWRKDAKTKSVKSFPWNAGSGLIVSRSGALLSVRENGLSKFDPQTETSTEFPFDKPQKIASMFSYYLYESKDGAVWIFGLEGLTKAVSTATGYQFSYFRNNPADRASLSSDIVLSVADDPLEPDRYLWVGTKSGGLNRLDKKTNQFKQYKTAEGLPDNVVYGILAEDAKPFIWLSTNKGLCRFHVREETTKNFTAVDGLQDNEFNSSSYLKLRDGTMIFGGVKGISVFHPDSLHFNEHVPQIRIVGLSVNNKDFNIAGKNSITLSHEQNLLNFEFAALEFTNPAQNQYRYQLEGVDNHWIALGHKNSIQFANLAPGTYTLRAQGSNNDGLWSEQVAEFKFTIRPPWWASWWAYVLYFLLVAVGVWGYYQYLLRQRLEHQETLRLRELDDFKSRFFTNITHEFRTPLTVMLGMSEQLAKEEKDEPKHNKLGLIKRSGENLLRLVNQILDLAKLESNTLKMNYIQGDILTFIRYIAESLHSLANAQNLMLRVESDQAKIIMDYDPERFLQIIHNLLSNAIKFTPSGGKVILRADIKDQWLHISVADSGAGIPPEELPHLFERFFQARNQEHSKAGGTGIGLSLTRELVRAMGGEITVESAVGKGSTFFVKLPVTNNSTFEEKVTEIWKAPTVNSPASNARATNDSDRPSILLIEDNPDVVEYLNACLQGSTGSVQESHPYTLDFAYNGQAGIETALETIPDLIISDVMMPLKDGFEVVEALKNDERTSHIPIILLTAKADVQSRLAGLRRGADAYLSKPFHQEELLVVLENLLESRRKLQAKYQQKVLASMPLAPAADTPDIEDSFLQKVRAIVEKNISDADFEMPQLERALAMSRSQIFRKIKALTGKSPSLFIRSIRLHHGKQMLLNTTRTVSEIAYEVGFTSLNYFSDAFLEEFGERPMKLRGTPSP